MLNRRLRRLAVIEIQEPTQTFRLYNPALAWPLPGDVWLEPGQRQIIFCDTTPSAGIYHASFKLPRTGERVYLVRTADWVILDSLCFEALPADTSFGVLGGGTNAQILAWPTPGAENLPLALVSASDGLFGRFLSLPSGSRQFVMRWQSASTNACQIEWSDDLKTWYPASPANPLGLGLFEWNDPNPPVGRRFYRAAQIR